MSNQKLRDSNFELLRIFAMFGIIISHIINHGWHLVNIYEVKSNSDIIASALTCLGASGNILFMLLSGYFLVNSTFKLHKCGKIWFEMFTYSVIIAFIAKIFHWYVFPFGADWSLYVTSGFDSVKSTIPKKDLILSFFPFLNNSNWFGTAYIIFYCFVPFLNKLIGVIDKKTHIYLIIILLVFGVVIPSFPIIHAGIITSKLYLFIMCFCLGSFVRVYGTELGSLFSRKLYIWGGVLTFFVIILLYFLGFVLFKNRFPDKIGTYIGLINDNNRMLIILFSLFVFMAFKDSSIGYKKIINSLGAACFGVYLIHSNRNFQWYLFNEILDVSKFRNSWSGLLFIFCISMGIFISCAVIDLFRQVVLEKLLINKILERLKKNK